ncbi:MAG: GNAT family N-acetyltransferase [Deltaproteobacteria bacterium]|nr:GNAT family N-acetyltransferase [Deltaproteobacteria bacterium]
MPTLVVPTGVRSPGWRSDLGLHSALGSLEELPEGWRCELPSIPDNPFGNMLVLRGAPGARTPQAVAALFDDHFGATEVTQLCVGWDDPGADASTLAPFIAQGFQAIDDVALAFEGAELDTGRTATGGDVRLRRLDLGIETARVLACELAVDARRATPYGPVAVRRSVAWSRAVLAVGDTADGKEGEPTAGSEIGGWYGAEVDGQVVATLGIVSVGGHGRLQSVGTHPSHRNRGIGSALLAWAWRDAAARLDLDRLLLITSRDGDAERFYRRMGFRRTGGNLGVLRAV